MTKVAVVIGRYGQEVIGGAEHLARHFAEALARYSDWDVEVLTTCSIRHTTWENEYEPGSEVVNGVMVRRFAVTPTDYSERSTFNQMIFQGNRIAPSTQLDWILSGEYSAELLSYVAQNQATIDYFVCLPYIGTIPFAVAAMVPDKSIVMPCVHDEFHAYFQPFSELFSLVAALVFLTPEEAQLAVKLGYQPRKSLLLGMGVEAFAEPMMDDAPDEPYLLYIGRLSEGKNVRQLYELAQRNYAHNGIRLLVAGDGNCKPPDHPAITYVGRVDEREKQRLLSQALALCQPSLNESFSIVIMEAWQCERPVIVHANCPVTVGHVKRCHGGLYYKNSAEMTAAVDYLLQNREVAKAMGENGKRYVDANYRWQQLIGRFVAAFSPDQP